MYVIDHCYIIRNMTVKEGEFGKNIIYLFHDKVFYMKK